MAVDSVLPSLVMKDLNHPLIVANVVEVTYLKMVSYLNKQKC